VSTATPTVARAPRRERFALEAADWAFIALLVLAVVIVVVETRGMSFFGDDWDFIVQRRGLSAHTLLAPHGPHLSLFPILIYKVLLKVFGGGSYLPFRLLSAFDLALLAFALGLACRDWWGRWWGLAPVLLLVTLGPAGVSTLWSFQVGFALAVSFGVFALLALQRRGPWSEVICCACLIVSLGSASQGIGFVVGAALMIVLTGDWRRRAWCVVAPAVLYLIWYLAIGHKYGETHLSLWPAALSYEMQALGVTAAALCGLSSVVPSAGVLDSTFAAPFAVAIVALVIVAAWRGWRAPAIFWGAAATVVVVWFAAAVSDFPPYGRPPTEPRYLASDAILLLICLCAAVPRPRLARGGLVIAGIVLAVVCATNADQYRQQHHFFERGAQEQRAELGALELMRGFVSPTYNPGAVDANLVDNSAQPFFSAVAAFGLREDDAAQISAQPQSTRESVDRILGPNELTLTLTPRTSPAAAGSITVLSGSPRREHGCLVIGSTALDVDGRPGTYTVSASTHYPSTVTAGRFASGYDDGLGTIPTAQAATITIRSDLAPEVPWRLALTGTGARVCKIK
jgi:hypothetical protein